MFANNYNYTYDIFRYFFILGVAQYLGHWYQMYADIFVLGTFQKGAFCATADVSTFVSIFYYSFLIYTYTTDNYLVWYQHRWHYLCVQLPASGRGQRRDQRYPRLRGTSRLDLYFNSLSFIYVIFSNSLLLFFGICIVPEKRQQARPVDGPLGRHPLRRAVLGGGAR